MSMYPLKPCRARCTSKMHDFSKPSLSLFLYVNFCASSLLYTHTHAFSMFRSQELHATVSRYTSLHIQFRHICSGSINRFPISSVTTTIAENPCAHTLMRFLSLLPLLLLPLSSPFPPAFSVMPFHRGSAKARK